MEKDDLEIPRAGRRKINTQHLGTIQVASKGGINFYPFLSLMCVNSRHYLVQYKEHIPSGREVLYNTCDSFKSNKVADSVANKFMDAVDSWELYKGYHLNPYTFLVTYLLIKDVDLVKEGVFDI